MDLKGVRKEIDWNRLARWAVHDYHKWDNKEVGEISYSIKDDSVDDEEYFEKLSQQLQKRI